MEDANSKLNELARLALNAQNYFNLYEKHLKAAKEKQLRNWWRTDDGKRSLAAMDSLINTIGESMELSLELLGKTEDVNKTCEIISQGSVKIIKLNHNKKETIDEDGGIYETPVMVGLRQTNYDPTSTSKESTRAKTNYKEDLSIKVNETYFSLSNLLVETYGDEAADILTPLIAIFDANAKQKVQKRLDSNAKDLKRYHDTKAEKVCHQRRRTCSRRRIRRQRVQDEDLVSGKSKAWWFKKGLERMNGMGVTQCTVVGDGRSAEGLSLHIEKKVWRYTDDKTGVELQDRFLDSKPAAKKMKKSA